MDTKTQLENALKDAMRSNDDVRRRTIRMTLAAIRQAEVDRQISLDESGLLAIIQKEIKNRREAIEEAKKASRDDLVGDNQAEVDVLQSFLPKALSPEELRALVQAAVTESGASGPSDMGKVMKVLMPRIQGRAPGDQVSQAVRELLQQ